MGREGGLAHAQHITMQATTNPHSGPAMPTSNRTLRLGNGALMRMTAPKVPMKLSGIQANPGPIGAQGAGMKNGSVELTP